MDIDLGQGIDVTQAGREILNAVDLPILFLSCHFGKEVRGKTGKITSCGFAVKNTGMPVLDASIKMAFKISLGFHDNGMGLPKTVSMGNPQEFGLHLVKLLVMQINGFLTIHLNEGTEFIIEYPVP